LVFAEDFDQKFVWTEDRRSKMNMFRVNNR